MSKTTKLISLITLAVIVVAGIAALAISSSEKGSTNNATSSGATTATPTTPTLTVDGEVIENPGTILTVGDTEFSFDEYRYYYMSTLSQYAMYGMDLTTPENAETAASIKTGIDDTLIDMAALLQIAKDKGITLTQEDKDEMDTQIEELKTQYGDSLETTLSSAYLIDLDFYTFLVEQSLLAQKAQDALSEEAIADDKEALMDSVITAKHILIPFETTTTDAEGNTVELSEEEIAANKAAAKETADSISAAIQESSDPIATFETYFTEYQANDPGQTAEGYTFREGAMVDSFYQGALALNTDEISAPIESTYGYHIILRLPLNETYVEENLSTLFSAEITPYITEKLDAMIETLPITYGEYYEAITPSSIT